jgi:hypothetical protein
VAGLVHAACGAPSREHKNAAEGSPSVQANATDGPLGSVGVWLSDGVGGAVVSRVHERTAGDGSVLPAGSVALTVSDAGPSNDMATWCGDVHGEKVPPDRRHWSDVPDSLAPSVNEYGPDRFVGPEGPDWIDVSGGVTSTVQDREEGVVSRFPAASVARTSNTCDVSVRPDSVVGDVQATKAPPSTEHWNDAPCSSDE